jgi:nucleotide-binding universal stress UspA family protein
VGIDRNTTEVIWEEGKTVQVLSQVCYEQKVDLLLLGAMKNEDMLRYYIGSVARRISRNPPCSLLLITEPRRESNRLNSVVVSGIKHPKTAYTIKEALDFASSFGVKEFSIVEEVKPSEVQTKIEDDSSLQKAFRERENLSEREDKRIESFIATLNKQYSFSITNKCIFGKVGYSIAHFAEVKGADLLVVNSPDKKLGFLDRFFPHDLEYILSDMPCDLLIVHSD